MAPKRFKKSDKNVKDVDKYKNISISDVLCPICRSILVEPVTLPCSHGFCFACFNGTMENTSLSCPLCRIRVGSWLRSARKDNRVVDGALWQVVQRRFPQELKRKLDGEDDALGPEPAAVKLAGPGEIRHEYEQQVARDRQEQQRQREAEAKASQLTIHQILEDEQTAAKLEAEKLRLDEDMARRLAAELDKPTTAALASVTAVAAGGSRPATKRSSLDRYLIALDKRRHRSDVAATALCPARPAGCASACATAYKNLLLAKTLRCERADSNGSDSGDSIKQEMRYFKPIRLVPKSAGRARDDGAVRAPLLKVPPLLARQAPAAVVRSPQNGAALQLVPHPRSAFVSCSPQPAAVAPPSPEGTRPAGPSAEAGAGRAVRQYYNRRRRHTGCSSTATAAAADDQSPPCSPVLGFDMRHERSDVAQMCSVLRDLSARVDGLAGTAAAPAPRPAAGPAPADAQEQLDLEFAWRLHEQINNPRHREYATRARPGLHAKRQATLDELVRPKKFKI